MSQNQRRTLAPFVSIFILVVISLVYLFFKMELVREGYEVLRLSHEHKIASEEGSQLSLHYAKLIRPERLDQIGTQRLALGRVQKNQVILMAATGGFAVRQ